MSTSKLENTAELMTTLELRESERYRLFANRRRRLLLDVLTTVGTPCTLSEVAAGIAARERGEPERPNTDRADVEIALHHVHLPLIDDAGLIDYDADEHRIEADRTSLDLLIE